MTFEFEQPALSVGNEVVWAQGRLTDRIYVHKSFSLDLRASQDYGAPARYIVKVFDEAEQLDPVSGGQVERQEWVVATTPGGRKQIKLQVAREAGQVRELVIQKVPTDSDATKLEHVLTLGREGAARLIDLIRMLDYIPVEGEKSLHVDEQLLRDFFADPSAAAKLYRRDPERFRGLIEDDEAASDVVAIAHRRQVVRRFRRLLEDGDYFDQEASWHHGRPEAVWQHLLEQDPWILGATLTGQLLTSWSSDRLEQVVAGFSVTAPGKRVDALMRTNGRIRALVFAEIKHHRTPLLSNSEYRPGCWAPSSELSGGVTQVQQTVHRASREIRDHLPDTDETGADTGERTYLIRPRSYLIAGSLDQLRGPRGVHRPKYESFELFRRNLYEPELITFDELLARAEWQVSLLDGEVGG
jgi:hypothetical protein